MTELTQPATPPGALSPQKRALLDLLLKKKGIDAPRAPQGSLPTITPAPAHRHQAFPLTDVQQAYWMGQKGIFELGGVGAHSYLELESTGLDVGRLNRAWQRLIARHDMLRTIVLADGRQQVLEKIPPYEVEVTDLREEIPEAARHRLEALRQRLSHRVQEPEGWPLIEIRASLLPGGRTRLHLNVNALVVDAWSLQILARELARLIEDPEAELAPLALSFRDYVLGEEAVRRSEIYQRSEQYWRQRLSTLPPAPDLPLAQSPGSLGQPRFTRCSARLEPERWQRLKKQATEAALTPSGVLIAAFTEVLDAWSASPRFTINLTLFNRLPLHPEVNALVGDFTSLTLLAVDAAAGDTFAERARQVQKQLWDDLDHRHVSGVKVMRELAGRERGALRALMPVVFTSTLTQDDADRNFTSPTALGELVYNITQTPQVWLDHQIYEQDGTLVFNWDAVDGLFPEGMLDAMFAAYRRLLERLAEETASWHEAARQRLPAAELAQRLAPVDAEPPISEALLHTLFAEQVSRRPRQPAVVASGRTLTYQELDRRALGLAHRLHAAGAGADRLVAVVMDKGWEEVVAVLAILRAGAAYLPIAASLPRERIWHLLEAGEVELVLTQSQVEERLEWPPGLERRCVDHEQPAAADERPLELAQSPGDLAYVIYTSGSTGLPKGVMIDHRGAVNTILDVNRRFAVGPGDRVLALSSLGFDLSVYDVFGTLAAGGTIVVPDAAATRDPAQWAELIHEHGVSLWNSVPALMEMLVAYVEKRPELRPRSLRLVLLSGDWIAVTLPERIKAVSAGVEVISLGGATEASIWSILYPIAGVDPGWTSIPYGRAMVHQRIYVLDHALEHCPVWVRGRIFIAGIGLARGYWGNEEQTRASFLVHPRSGERLYRTGDLGRYLPDGNIEILGREDFQVKIRGHRIELGEIETALDQHPAVKTGVVAAVGESRQSQRLVAYIVLEEQWEPATPEPESRQEIVMDPVERLQFKLSHPGLREESGRRSIELARPELGGASGAPYVERRSYREFSSEPMDRARLEALLGCLLEVRFEGLPLPKRRYGSAGSLYPVQVYLWVKPGRIADLAPGTYYHHPREHRLVELEPGVEIDPKLYDAANRPIFRSAAFAVFLIAQLEAIAPLYGEAARHYATLEAGLITQLLEMQAPVSDLGLCQIGRMDFAPIRSWFALAPSHVLLHSLLGGGIEPEQATLDGLRRESSDNLAFIELLHSQLQEATPAAPAAGRESAQKPDVQDDLRRFLQTKLPEYMVPSAFVFLDELPLSPTGKVDRKALVAPRAPEVSPTRRAAPRTELERSIAAIWQEVLELDEVGVDDSFFELGGNSVQMVRVHGKLREVLGHEVAILDLFKYPTVGTLAEFLGSEEPQVEALQQVDERAEKTRAGKDRLRRFRKRQLQSRQGDRQKESGDE